MYFTILYVNHLYHIFLLYIHMFLYINCKLFILFIFKYYQYHHHPNHNLIILPLCEDYLNL